MLLLFKVIFKPKFYNLQEIDLSANLFYCLLQKSLWICILRAHKWDHVGWFWSFLDYMFNGFIFSIICEILWKVFEQIKIFDFLNFDKLRIKIKERLMIKEEIIFWTIFTNENFLNLSLIVIEFLELILLRFKDILVWMKYKFFNFSDSMYQPWPFFFLIKIILIVMIAGFTDID